MKLAVAAVTPPPPGRRRHHVPRDEQNASASPGGQRFNLGYGTAPLRRLPNFWCLTYTYSFFHLFYLSSVINFFFHTAQLYSAREAVGAAGLRRAVVGLRGDRRRMGVAWTRATTSRRSFLDYGDSLRPGSVAALEAGYSDDYVVQIMGKCVQELWLQ